MDPKIAETLVKQISDLTNGAGWQKWWIPFLHEQKEAIKNSLVTDLPEAETAKLRARFKLLTELEAKPAQQLAAAKDALKDRQDR